MNIIICGAGRVGFTIAKLLSEQGHSITVIDQSSEDIQKINDSLDVKAIVGKGTYPSILEKANASETDMIISIFAGRIADTGIDPIPMMSKAVNICKTKKNIEILWASTRELINIFQANQINCQIITVPHDILKKISLIGKNLEDLSLETVQMFLTDATKAGYKIKINK